MPRRNDISSILVIGSGPIIIGQACEFDYSGTQACRVLRQEGYRVILANSNPATIMTDPLTADATYVEPLDVAVLTAIIERERPDALLPTLGGQTALNLTMQLVAKGIPEKFPPCGIRRNHFMVLHDPAKEFIGWMIILFHRPLLFLHGPVRSFFFSAGHALSTVATWMYSPYTP